MTISGLSVVHGWFLDGSGVSKVEILIDGKAVGTAQYGLSRPDVAKVYPQYKNSNSGYQYTLDTREFTNKKHSIAVEEIGKNGETTKTYSQIINVQNLPAKGSLDTPSNGMTISGLSVVHGWFLDGSGVSKVEILIDGKAVGTAQYGLSRPDVAKVYPQYKNSNSGYQYTLDTGEFTNGKHSINIQEIGNNGEATKTYIQTINVQNLPAKGYVDSPSNGSNIYGTKTVSVSGWFLDGSRVSKVEILIDGKVIGTAQYGLSRPDVAKAYPQYKNSNSGYKYSLSVSSLSNGQHTLTVKEIGRNGSDKSLNNKTIYNYVNWLQPTGGPYPELSQHKSVWIKVSTAMQRVYIMDGNKTIYTMICSSGVDSSTTPKGTFYIQAERGLSFYSRSEGEGAKYWVSFLHHGEYLFHTVPTDKNGNYITSEAIKLGEKASHGCIRLSVSDAKWFYTNIKYGTKVIIN